MSRVKKRKPLPGPEYRYDAYGRIIKRKRLPYGPRHSQPGRHVTADLARNNQDCIYMDIPCEGSTTKFIMAADVEKIKKEADLSGNPKVWTAEEYSQEFLRTLITRN